MCRTDLRLINWFVVQAWPKGSLESVVENLVKTWEMELSHKIKVTDFKTIDQEKFTISVNGEFNLLY